MKKIMSSVYEMLSFFILFEIYMSCHCSSMNSDNTTLIERPYCFRLTWLGPKYNEESQFKNATCSDVIKSDKKIVCTHPLVVTS